MSRTSADRLELLARLLAEKGIRHKAGASIPKRESGDEAPLSFAQSRLWFLEQLDPGTSIYNDSLSVRITGRPLDPATLQLALNELVRRHEILRTSFTSQDGDPLQVIHADARLELRFVDLSGSAADVEAEIERILVDTVRQPFAFDAAPLARAVLIRRAANDHEFALALHHIISDGVSYGIAWRELGQLYESIASAEPSPRAALKPLPLQFADYAAWERTNAEERSIAEKLEFWSREIGAGHPCFGFPTDRARPAQHEQRGAFHRFALSDALYRSLTEFCRRHEVTANWVLLATYYSLLAADAGSEDVCVALGSTSRTRRELEPLIGFFVRTVLLRVELTGNPTFHQIIERTRSRALAVSKFEDVPFDRIVKTIREARGGDEPILRTWFGYMKDLMPPFHLAGGDSSYRIIDGGSARFELSLILDDAEGQLSAYFEYDTDLFEPATIADLTARYLEILRLALEHPDTTLTALRDVGRPAQRDRTPNLPAEMRRRLLEDFARTSTPKPATGTVLDLLADVVARAPSTVAVTADGTSLTYRELAERSHGLARKLQDLGVTPGTFVGVHATRSVDLVVALLAVLEAGAAYLPLPPDYPSERLAFMLADTRAPIVLTRSTDAGTLPSTDARIIRIDEAAITEMAELRTPPQASDPAYVIYTSGSTGKPKGVPITHANLISSTRARLDYYEKPVDAFLWLSSYAFDSSVAGLFWTLCSGGKLVLPPEGFEQDIAALARLIDEENISHLLALPPLYAALLEHAPAGALAKLSTVIVAGESLGKELIEAHMTTLPEAGLFNEYGPTEGTVWCTVFDCRTPFDRPQVPIGRPIPGAEVYLLDGARELVPIGEVGELFVGGPGVASGYLGRPEFTAERFHSHPFRKDFDERLYATGDLARFLDDGTIEFLGRRDHQVKIRGYRIELEEIDAILGRHPNVREALVHAREDRVGDKRLVGYVVCNEPIDVASLRQYLAADLPTYMIPPNFVFLDELPHLPNGKVDRSRLPAPDASTASARYRPPRTDLERVLAGIWADVLDVERVGVDDDFFELGGHSILATKLFARIVDTLQVQIPLRALFDGRTLGHLAETMLAAPEERARIERTAEIVLQLLGVGEQDARASAQ